jgi:hypothetical protein
MSNPFLAELEHAGARAIPSYPDDDDDDEAGDDDDEEGLTAPLSGRWVSCSGFASPEWWSRH